jgi:ADP-ribose pyrophosphatase YjhB (NUDIX family)
MLIIIHIRYLFGAVMPLFGSSRNSPVSFNFMFTTLMSVSAGLALGYFLFRKKEKELTNEEIAHVVAQRAERDPNALKPITGVYQYFLRGWRPVFFPGDNNAPGFFATPFQPSLNGGPAHVVCEKDGEFYYLINLQKRKISDGNYAYVADLPSGFLNSGDAPQRLARTQYMIKQMGMQRQKQPQMSFAEYQALNRRFSNEFPPSSTVEIDTSMEEGIRRECEEETGLRLTDRGEMFNLMSINNGAYLIAHMFYKINCENGPLPKLKPKTEEGIVRSEWVNIKAIKVARDESSGKYAGTVTMDGREYQIKPFDRIADHMTWVLQNKTPHPIRDSVPALTPPASETDTRYNTRIFGM